MVYDHIRRRLSAARETGDVETISLTLLDAAESTPLFHDRLLTVRDWIIESRELAGTCVIEAALGPRLAVRQAEVMLALGQPVVALTVARRAEALAVQTAELGLQDRALAIASRALVRLRRRDEALELMTQVAGRQMHPLLDDTVAPALSFLAVGEAHLCQGHYQGAVAPLEMGLERLPADAAADRLRWDTLMALAALDHRRADFGAMRVRLDAAEQLVARHDARMEASLMHSLRAVTARHQGDSPELALRALIEGVDVAPADEPHWFTRRFITERLQILVGARSLVELSRRIGTQAAGCGEDRDLVGYLLLVALEATVRDAAGEKSEAKALLRLVEDRLLGQGEAEAGMVLAAHRQALE